MEITFKFEIGQLVRAASGVTGRVIAATHGREKLNSYWVEYIVSSGRVTETCVPESELTAA